MIRHKGFTLIEILLAVGLAGIIAVAALAPLVFTVQSLETVQKGWGKNIKVMETAERIFSDTRNFARSSSFPVFRTVHKEGFTRSYLHQASININRDSTDGRYRDGGLRQRDPVKRRDRLIWTQTV